LVEAIATLSLDVGGAIATLAKKRSQGFHLWLLHKGDRLSSPRHRRGAIALLQFAKGISQN
jgi:hypothetical protein